MAQRQPGVLPPPNAFAPPPPEPANAGGGRARGRRRGGGRGGRQAQAGAAPYANAPPPGGNAPRPSSLSSSNTAERNDPLWTSGFGGADMAPMPNIEYVYSSACLLPLVVQTMHVRFCARSAGYARRVSHSAFSYYCAVLVWYRMLSLQRMNGFHLSADEERFVEQVPTLLLEAPLLLAHYLSGYGNTRVPSGREIRFRMLDRRYVRCQAGSVGWFGQVDEATQPLYQNYPCLAVYATKVLVDVDPNDDAPYWDLPEGISPVIDGALRPSDALLGYGRRSVLSREQTAFFAASGIVQDEHFPSANAEIPLSLSLLQAIHAELRQVDGIKLSPVPVQLVGSQAQLARVIIEDELRPYVAEKSYTLESPYCLPAEISFPASAFCYRLYHDIPDEVPADGIVPWCVYRLVGPGAVDWLPIIAAGNRLRAGEPEFLGISEFRTTPYLVRARLESFENALNRGG